MVSISNLFATDQKVGKKAKTRDEERLIISFFTSLFIARNRKSMVIAPKKADIRFSLYAISLNGNNENSFPIIEKAGYPVGASTSIVGTCIANQLVSPPISFCSSVDIYIVRGTKKAIIEDIKTLNLSTVLRNLLLIKKFIQTGSRLIQSLIESKKLS
jgi:hypothetical protein